MRKYIVCAMGLMMVLGIAGLSSAAIVTDATGDFLGTGQTDILAAQAEQKTRGDGVAVLKISYTASPNLGGIMIFEADVDSSTGTGGALSMTGIPVSPCPCKTTAGIDVAIVQMNRTQAATSQTAICIGTPLAAKRVFGEYFAVASGLGTTDVVGVLRGFAQPTTSRGATSKCYTYPWATILTYVNQAARTVGEGWDYNDGLNPANTRWQLSLWDDADFFATDKDDFADLTGFFNISDVMPNGDGNLVVGIDVATAATFCEGNSNFNNTVDGTDAAVFKTDFGRKNCPTCNDSW